MNSNKIEKTLIDISTTLNSIGNDNNLTYIYNTTIFVLEQPKKWLASALTRKIFCSVEVSTLTAL